MESWARENELEEDTVQALVAHGFKSRRALAKLTADLIKSEFPGLSLAQKLLLQEGVEFLQAQQTEPSNSTLSEGAEAAADNSSKKHDLPEIPSKLEEDDLTEIPSEDEEYDLPVIPSKLEEEKRLYGHYINWTVIDEMLRMSKADKGATSNPRRFTITYTLHIIIQIYITLL